jgi:hypothetical protein
MPPALEQIRLELLMKQGNYSRKGVPKTILPGVMFAVPKSSCIRGSRTNGRSWTSPTTTGRPRRFFRCAQPLRGPGSRSEGGCQKHQFTRTHFPREQGFIASMTSHVLQLPSLHNSAVSILGRPLSLLYSWLDKYRILMYLRNLHDQSSY